MSQSITQSGRCAMLMGSPRSGTTWLAKIIDSHPDVLYRHEPDSINVRPEIPFVPDNEEIEQYLEECRTYLSCLKRESASKSIGSQPMFSKSYRGALSEQCRRLLIYAVKGGERVFGGEGVLSRVQIPDLIRTGQGKPPLIFMKSVSSLCRSYMFSRAVPDLKVLHIVRHPCAYVASTLRGKKLGLLSDDAYIETLAKMPESHAYGLTLADFSAMSREEQLASRWMLQNEKVAREMEAGTQYKRVIYEDLCSDPLGVASELFDFLELPMNEQSREFIVGSSGGKSAEPRYFDVRRDSAKAASGWMKELRPEQIEQIQRLVAVSPMGQLYVGQ